MRFKFTVFYCSCNTFYKFAASLILLLPRLFLSLTDSPDLTFLKKLAQDKITK